MFQNMSPYVCNKCRNPVSFLFQSLAAMCLAFENLIYEGQESCYEKIFTESWCGTICEIWDRNKLKYTCCIKFLQGNAAMQMPDGLVKYFHVTASCNFCLPKVLKNQHVDEWIK